jgi:hypothetical protein
MLFHSGGNSVARVLRQTPTTSAGAPAEMSSLSKLEEEKNLLAMEANTEGSGEIFGGIGGDALDTVSLQDAATAFINDLACKRKIEQNDG